MTNHLPSARRRTQILTAAASAMCGAGLLAWAQSDRPLRILVEAPAGGTADILARLVGEGLATGVPNIRAGKLRTSAVSAPQRSHALPDLHTFAELGFGELTRTAWLGLWVHPEVPATTQQRIREEALKAMAVPAVRDRLMAVGLNVNVQNPPTPEQLWASVAADHRAVGDMLRSVNYKPE